MIVVVSYSALLSAGPMELPLSGEIEVDSQIGTEEEKAWRELPGGQLTSE